MTAAEATAQAVNEKIDASVLKKIQQICSGQKSCDHCPLLTGDEVCLVIGPLPCAWDVEKIVHKMHEFHNAHQEKSTD